jgi:hypothetical protein
MRPPSGPRPREIGQLVEDLQRARGREPDSPVANPAAGDRGRAVFLIGAGCSASAEIPLAAGVAQNAVSKLAAVYKVADPAADALAALRALVDAGKFPTQFAPEKGVPPWGQLYSYVFSEHMKHPNEQRELISALVGDREYALNWAHACLGALVEKRFVHTILTTNFDQLVLQGVIRTGIVPVVADGLESLNRISPTPKRPQVVHLHGSMHTYELRNSYAALLETEHDRGLQVMMMSLLKEASVLVVVGYAGGEEGVMTLLQYAATALPRMVVYWIAFEDDFDLLSKRAKELLSTGENKFFILGQRADDFFNKLVGELGIGAPDWIRRPLDVLKGQAKISYDAQSSADVARLANAYADRVEFAAENGVREDREIDIATELRSALRYADAARAIEKTPKFESDDELLALHADSLFNQYKRSRSADKDVLNKAIDEFGILIGRTGTSRIGNIITFIEAQRDLMDQLAFNDDALDRLIGAVQGLADKAQASLDEKDNLREWSLLSFYRAEAMQAKAEQARRAADEGHDSTSPKDRKAWLDEARKLYVQALPGLSATDATKARECKEGLAGALIGLSEYEREGVSAASHLREAQTLFREVMEFARTNTPDREYAGALENLADAIRSMRLKFHDEAHGSRAEEQELIGRALDIYEAIGDSTSASRMRDLLD